MTVTLDIPADTERELRKLSRREDMTLEETICDILRRRVAMEHFDAAAKVVQAKAREAGFTSEEQIIEACT